MKVSILLIFSLVAVALGDDLCNGANCSECLEDHACLYIREKNGEMTCIVKKLLLKYHFVKVVSKIERCGPMLANPPIPSPNLPALEETSQKHPLHHISEPDAPSSKDTVERGVSTEIENHSPVLIMGESAGAGNINSLPFPKEEPKTPPSLKSSSVEIKNIISFGMEPNSTDTDTPTPQSQPLPVINTEQPKTTGGETETIPFIKEMPLFNFSFGLPFACNDTDLKMTPHYPVMARIAHGSCRLLHLMKKMQREMDIPSELTEWNSLNPAVNFTLHCNFLRFYKTECGRKFV